MSLAFRRVCVDDAELLLKWRTSPEITRHMYTDLRDPCLDTQRDWIASIANSETYRGYIILDDQTPVGYVCFSDIDYHHKHCSTGSYIYERSARLKYALTLHTYICNYVFSNLQLNKIVNYVLDANEKVVKLQKLHKSRLVGCLKQHIYKNDMYHDVHIFEQLEQDWRQQKQHFSAAQIRAAFNDWTENE